MKKEIYPAVEFSVNFLEIGSEDKWPLKTFRPFGQRWTCDKKREKHLKIAIKRWPRYRRNAELYYQGSKIKQRRTKKIPYSRSRKGHKKTDTNLTSAAGLNDRLAHSAGLIRIGNQKLVFALLQCIVLMCIDIWSGVARSVAQGIFDIENCQNFAIFNNFYASVRKTYFFIGQVIGI